MRRNRVGGIFAVVVLAAALGGCSAVSNLAGNIDEPAGTPARPTAVFQYPAVHDMPPTRPDKPLTDEQQVQLEKSLEDTRDRQEGVDSSKTPQKTAQTPKKSAGPPIQIVPAGSRPNP